MSQTQRASRSLAFALCMFALGAAGGSSATAAPRSAPQPVVRDPLGTVDGPVGAKGKTLGLSLVTIPAGARIALHHHAGTQVAYVAQGVLTYSVKSGSVSVMRGPAGTSTLVRRIGPGQTGRIAAGEWIVEQPTTIHRAANEGKQKVVIYLATLFPVGSPASIPNG